MKRVVKIVSMMSLLALFMVFNVDEISAAAHTVNVNDGTIEITGNPTTNQIDIYQNSVLINSVDVADTIEIIGDGTVANNYIEIDITNLTSPINICLKNVTIDTTAMYYAALNITGTSAAGATVNVSFEGNNVLKSNKSYAGNLSNGISSKFASNANVVLDGMGILDVEGYDCGIYIKDGNLSLNNGTVYSASSHSDATAFGVGIYANNGNIEINGGTVNAKAKANGIYATKSLKINGGTVTAQGSMRRGAYAGKDFEVTGGQTYCEGFLTGVQVNAAGANYKTFQITGGTIAAKALSTLDDWVVYGKNALVNGGSVKGVFSSSSAKRVNDAGEDVFLTTLSFEDGHNAKAILGGEIDGVACTAGAGSGAAYGIKDVYTDDEGKLYFYLTNKSEGKVRAEVEGVCYQNLFVRTGETAETLYKDRTLTFEYKSQSGVTTDVYPVPYGEAFSGSVPQHTALEGYIFENWYVGNAIFDSTAPITADTKAVAKYSLVPLTLDAVPLNDGQMAQDYTALLPAASGGVPAKTYTLTGLPIGLTFDEATRTISGEPLESGAFTLVYTAKDSEQQEAMVTLLLTINAASSSSGSDVSSSSDTGSSSDTSSSSSPSSSSSASSSSGTGGSSSNTNLRPDPNVPATGDFSPVGLCIILFIVSGFLLGYKVVNSAMIKKDS